jgi:hypothetical protein
VDERDQPAEPHEDEEPREADAEEQDPESAPASSPPPGQDAGEGKTHDL